MPLFPVKLALSIEDRCEVFARYIIDNDTTVRDTAAFFGASKSTVHKDVTERLQRKAPSLYEGVKTVLERNKSERHLRGGNATKLRYEAMRKNTKNGY